MLPFTVVETINCLLFIRASLTCSRNIGPLLIQPGKLPVLTECCCMLLSGSAHAVALMSLRAQLQAPAGSTRPVLTGTLNTDNLHDASRCNVVLWVPRSNGSQFVAGHASGNLLIYKKVEFNSNAGRICYSIVSGVGG